MSKKLDTPLTPEELVLVRDNVKLAQFLFHRYRASFQKKADYGVDQDELLSQAYYGLIRAAKRYRTYGEENGYSEESIATGQFFGVFARKSIIGQMLDYLRKLDHVHTLVRKDYKLLVEHGLGSSDKNEEQLAIDAELSPERVQKVIRMVQAKPVNLDDFFPGAEQNVGDQLASHENVESSALETSLKEALVDAIDSLPVEVQDVIYLKYYLEKELPDIAELVQDTLTSVRRLHSDSLPILHGALVSKVLGA